MSLWRQFSPSSAAKPVRTVLNMTIKKGNDGTTTMATFHAEQLPLNLNGVSEASIASGLSAPASRGTAKGTLANCLVPTEVDQTTRIPSSPRNLVQSRALAVHKHYNHIHLSYHIVDLQISME